MTADQQRPVITVVDLETTGFDAPEHQPIEIGWCRLAAPNDLLGEPDWSQADLLEDGYHAALVNPGRPIPPEASAVHHLIACDLVDAEPWRTGLIRWIGGIRRPVAFAAHSAKMERQWCTPELVGEAPWICTWKCALRAWPDAPGHGNQVLRYWLRPEGLDRALATPAHRAGPDAYVTAFLLRELLRLHPLATLLQWSAEPAVLIRVPFGKRPEEGGNRGLRWTEVDDGFLRWTAARDFSDDILHTVTIEIGRRDAERQRIYDAEHPEPEHQLPPARSRPVSDDEIPF